MSNYYDKLLNQLKHAVLVTEQHQLIAELLDEGLKSVEISKKTNLHDYTVRHHARLHRKLTQSVKDLFLSQKISFSLARAIAGLPEKQQEPEARRAIAKHTSVQAFRSALQNNNDKQLVRELERLSDQLSSLSGLDIQITADKGNSQAGRWIIRYTDLSMFDTISEKIIGKCSPDEF